MILHALAAISRSWSIFPCNEPGTPDFNKPGEYADKQGHYLVPGKPYKIKWSEAATNNVAQVASWWAQWPQANYAVAVKPSGLLVVDCDTFKGPSTRKLIRESAYSKLLDLLDGTVQGYDVYEEMCRRSKGDWAEAEDTFTVMTGSGGLHFYYRWPAGEQASQASLLKGLLDIRCNGGENGGYVIGPGSRTSKGEYTIIQDLPVREVPDWLFARVVHRPPPPKVRPESLKVGDYALPMAPMGNFDGLLEAVRYAPEGNRNNMLLWCARSMCSDGLPLAEAEALLLDSSDLPNQEVLDTVRSAYRLQERKEG